jgi:hypothetical protein
MTEMQSLCAELEDIMVDGIRSQHIPIRRQAQSAQSFDVSPHLMSLRESLAEQCAELEAAAVSSGVANPFVRNKQFPPIHINLNYLIEPSRPFSGLVSVISSFRGSRNDRSIVVDRADPL